MINFTDNQDILTIMGVAPNDLENPRRLQMIEEIVGFYKGNEGAKHDILKVLSKDRREDKLDAVWIYTRLKKEKQERIQKLRPEDFVEDIEAELKRGVLTKDNLKRIKKDIEPAVQKRKAILEARKEREARENYIQKQEQAALGKIKLPSNVDEITSNLEAIEGVQAELDAYG